MCVCQGKLWHFFNIKLETQQTLTPRSWPNYFTLLKPDFSVKPGALTHNIIKWLRNISEDSLSSDGGQLCVRFSQEEALCQRNQWARPDRVRTGTDWSDLICQASPLVITNWFSGNKTRGRVVSAVEIDHMPSPHPYFVSDHIIKSQSMRLTLSQRGRSDCPAWSGLLQSWYLSFQMIYLWASSHLIANSVCEI